MHSEYEAVAHNVWLPKGDAISKLIKVREDSIIFNKEVFRNIFKKKRTLENRIIGAREKLEKVDSTSLILLDRQLQKDYSEVLKQEEMLCFQKSNEKWVHFGDRNTSFFHTQTIVRRKRNKIEGLFLSDGT